MVAAHTYFKQMYIGECLKLYYFAELMRQTLLATLCSSAGCFTDLHEVR